MHGHSGILEQLPKTLMRGNQGEESEKRVKQAFYLNFIHLGQKEKLKRLF